MSHPVREVRRRIQTEHVPIVEGIDECADRIADPWDTSRTTDRDAVVEGLGAELESAGLLEQLPVVLADAVAATGCELPAQPVAAPPYVVVTSRGPVLRATIDPGRLVIRFDVFDVVRDESSRCPPAYRRRNGVAITVSLE
ncbi:hypothetical protein [Natronolimnohabitans innermongolicus]|uniref:DUF7988 domain-containing protein n=1 Tax=Natronolimnohabitans innermongolicus JCM 12255 TaxID=1227499 RepID=L9XKI1_9EURY|nr:hypothetical protein [Natronolimnohabitans innermongolicus]ELY61926.1 hypothetical protein C493_01560 [Natronolimnohabitans innermongolicus JCM 12255]